MKFYHYKRNELPDDNDEVAIQALREKSKRQAEKERNLWHLMYPQYSTSVRAMELNQTYALGMPYFDPVQPNERIGYLHQIRLLLTDFEKKGYRYETDDLCWHHVCIRNKDIALIDMGSLEILENAELTTVEDQIAFMEASA